MRSLPITALFHITIIVVVDCNCRNMNPLMQEIKIENPCPGRATGFSGYYFNQLMNTLFRSHCALGDPNDYPKNSADEVRDEDEFDFVIIGGGSAGSVIANRLSDVSQWKILLIEAGGNPTFESDIPAFSPSMPGGDLDWKFAMPESMGACLGMEKETCVISQGKVLGGTSTVNKMHYLRGNPADYDEWAKMGNPGWAFDDVLPYFKKSEKLHDDFLILSEDGYQKQHKKITKLLKKNDWKIDVSSNFAIGKYHSKAGTMKVDRFAHNSYLSSLKRKLCQSANESGIPFSVDLNGKSQIGCAEVVAFLSEGNRGNAAKNYLSSVKNRTNLLVVKGATAEKLIVQDEAVTGVRFSVGGKALSVNVRKEVIISAGAINSPRLLLLSGIGPRKELDSIGVPVVHHLQGVGENMQMQISFYGLPISIAKEKIRSPDNLEIIDAMYYFISRGEGMFGNVGLNDVVTFLSTRNDTVPDIQLLHYFNDYKDYYSLNELLISLRLKNEIRDQFSKARLKSHLLLICPTLLRPKTTGKIQLAAPDSKFPPKISYNFLGHQENIETLIRGIETAIRITEAKAFREFSPEVLELKVKGCESHAFQSHEYWKCLIRHLATGTQEVSGSCKMGPVTDDTAVVDHELRVHGLKGVRVADSSIMPTMIRGSTVVASIMIGEKASDLIKKEWKKAKNDEL